MRLVPEIMNFKIIQVLHNNSYAFSTDGGFASVFRWAPGEPSGGAEDCLLFYFTRAGRERNISYFWGKLCFL